MNPRRASCVLWLVFCFLVPLPFFLSEVGFVPPVRALLLATASLWLLVQEGPEGAVRIAVFLLFGQAVLQVGFLWILARVSTSVARRGFGRHAPAFLGALVLGLAVASLFPIYRTPFRTASLRTNVFHLFE